MFLAFCHTKRRLNSHASIGSGQGCHVMGSLGPINRYIVITLSEW